MSVAFDTLKAAQRLNAAGFSEDQAASLAATFAEGITENLATKDDIALVHKEMEVLGKDIKVLDTRIDTSIAALDARIDTSIDKLRNDMTIRLGGIVLGGITALKLIKTFWQTDPAARTRPRNAGQAGHPALNMNRLVAAGSGSRFNRLSALFRSAGMSRLMLKLPPNGSRSKVPFPRNPRTVFCRKFSASATHAHLWC